MKLFVACSRIWEFVSLNVGIIMSLSAAGVSTNHTLSRACVAVNRCSGSYLSKFWSRSNPLWERVLFGRHPTFSCQRAGAALKVGNFFLFSSHSFRYSGQSESSPEGTPVRAKIRCSCSHSVLPGNRGFRSIISQNTQPPLHTSTAVGSYTFCPSRISGDRYHRVTMFDVYGSMGLPNDRASPKSHSFSTPRLLNSRFDDFTSRCTTQCEWRYCRAENICFTRVFTSAGLNGVFICPSNFCNS